MVMTVVSGQSTCMIVNVGKFVLSQAPIYYNDGVNAVKRYKHTELSLRTWVPIGVGLKKHYGEELQETQVFGLHGKSKENL